MADPTQQGMGLVGRSALRGRARTFLIGSGTTAIAACLADAPHPRCSGIDCGILEKTDQRSI